MTGLPSQKMALMVGVSERSPLGAPPRIFWGYQEIFFFFFFFFFVWGEGGGGRYGSVFFGLVWFGLVWFFFCFILGVGKGF